jgi:hypothetical protein
LCEIVILFLIVISRFLDLMPSLWFWSILDGFFWSILPIYCELLMTGLGTGGHFGISEFATTTPPPYLLFLLIGARRRTLAWEFKFLNELVYVLLNGLLTMFDIECWD